MALEEDLAEDGTLSPAASTSQVPQAAPLDASEDLMCPICLDTINDATSMSWCRHIFCFSSILEWSRRRAVCPICQWPFHYIYRKVRANNYEVYHIMQYNSSASHARGGRSQPHSAVRRQCHSSGHQHRRSSSRDCGTGCAGAPERGRSRSSRRHHDGHSRVQHAQGYDPSSSRRGQQSRAQDTAVDTARDEGRVPMPSNRKSRPPQGGASAVSREAKFPPGNGRGQGADPGGGPAALGTKHRGSSKGEGITTRGEFEALNSKSQLIPGEESTISREAKFPPGNGRGQGADPSGGPAALLGTRPGSTPYQEGYYCMPCY